MAKAKRKPRFFAYSRVSDKKQVVSGLSLEAQEEHARRYFDMIKAGPDRDDLLWGGLYAETAKSAYKLRFMERPKACEMVRRIMPGDHVFFSKLDRGFRNTLDFLTMHNQWKFQGVTMHFGDMGVSSDTPYGELQLTMIAAMAQLESRLKSERVKAAQNAKRLRGEAVNGPPPMGTQHVRSKGKKFVYPDRRMHIMMRWVRQHRIRTGDSFEKIAVRLDKILHLREIMSLPQVRLDSWCWIDFESVEDRAETFRQAEARRKPRPMWKLAMSKAKIHRMYKAGEKVNWKLLNIEH